MSHFDMLVQLYNHDLNLECIEELKKQNIIIRKPIAPEKSTVLKWIKEEFAQSWADEADISFSNNPKSIFIATRDSKVIGFACYDATALNFFGPTGVCSSTRGLGVGKALLKACMVDMKLKGYAYAIIGAVGATKIENSWPGIYNDILKG